MPVSAGRRVDAMGAVAAFVNNETRIFFLSVSASVLPKKSNSLFSLPDPVFGHSQVI